MCSFALDDVIRSTANQAPWTVTADLCGVHVATPGTMIQCWLCGSLEAPAELCRDCRSCHLCCKVRA